MPAKSRDMCQHAQKPSAVCVCCPTSRLMQQMHWYITLGWYRRMSMSMRSVHTHSDMMVGGCKKQGHVSARAETNSSMHWYVTLGWYRRMSTCMRSGHLQVGGKVHGLIAERVRVHLQAARVRPAGTGKMSPSRGWERKKSSVRVCASC